MSALYTIERWPRGWILCSVFPCSGIPLNALGECGSIFPKDAVIDSGISHYLLVSGHSNVVVCVGCPNELTKWRDEINKSLVGFEPESKWWHGLDVGKSSASVFAVFSKNWGYQARELGNGSVPVDSEDFGRCKRLLDIFPEWRNQLNKVVEAYPNTKWGKIVEKWEELEKSTSPQQNKILKEIA